MNSPAIRSRRMAFTPFHVRRISFHISPVSERLLPRVFPAGNITKIYPPTQRLMWLHYHQPHSANCCPLDLCPVLNLYSVPLDLLPNCHFLDTTHTFLKDIVHLISADRPLCGCMRSSLFSLFRLSPALHSLSLIYVHACIAYG